MDVISLGRLHQKTLHRTGDTQRSEMDRSPLAPPDRAYFAVGLTCLFLCQPRLDGRDDRCPVLDRLGRVQQQVLSEAGADEPPPGSRTTATPTRPSTAGPCRGAGTHRGSWASGALMIPSASRRSATRRAIGPWQLVIWIAIGSGHGCVTAPLATRPRDGRSAVVPHICDGTRREPPRSLPRPSGVMPLASAAASPPEEPPGVRVGVPWVAGAAGPTARRRSPARSLAVSASGDSGW